MVFVKIAAVVALIIGGLAYAKQQHYYEKIGVVGGCDLSAAPIIDNASAQWWSCHEGMLTGYPTLTRDNCRLYTVTQTRQLWRCPEAIPRPSAL
ncbi:MAG: hypothetical protein U0R50_15895 [Gaiellales bacterium]